MIYYDRRVVFGMNFVLNIISITLCHSRLPINSYMVSCVVLRIRSMIEPCIPVPRVFKIGLVADVRLLLFLFFRVHLRPSLLRVVLSIVRNRLFMAVQMVW